MKTSFISKSSLENLWFVNVHKKIQKIQKTSWRNYFSRNLLLQLFSSEVAPVMLAGRLTCLPSS